MSIGIYGVVSWLQGLALRDPVIFGMIFKCKALRNVIFAGGTATFMGVALGFWVVPFFQRYHGVNVGEVGAVIGVSVALMGFSGVLLGGVLADKLRDYTRKGKLYVWLVGITLSVLSAFLFLLADNLMLAYVGVFLMNLTGPMAHATGVSTINDLTLPRSRATVSAFAFMVATFVGIALGPYLIGYASDMIVSSTGVDGGEGLRQTMFWSLWLPIVGIGLVVLALKHIENEEDSFLERARELGEKI